ncbi:unnamed protein product [Wuchereria bancrofti]|uniref:Uncharacterized protein n=1 Tax=Wuchereria bancrofti TaxID=6293 RepID=A0A3P7ENC4_WUCBA|nr:unnamed protein product [Wuchereria bancrofti]
MDIVTRTQANRIETYACPPCISKDSSLKIMYRAAKREREKSVHCEKQCKSKGSRNNIKIQSGLRCSSKDDHGLIVANNVDRFFVVKITIRNFACIISNFVDCIDTDYVELLQKKSVGKVATTALIVFDRQIVVNVRTVLLL